MACACKSSSQGVDIGQSLGLLMSKSSLISSLSLDEKVLFKNKTEPTPRKTMRSNAGGGSLVPTSLSMTGTHPHTHAHTHLVHTD